MKKSISDLIRELARTKFVQPAIATGNREFAIRVREILDELPGSGHTPQICSALRTAKFLRENDLEISRIEGPPSGQSPTVVIHYRVADRKVGATPGIEPRDDGATQQAETPEEWAHRMTGEIFGLLKDEITAMGGTEAFMRWVRSEDEDSAAEDAA